MKLSNSLNRLSKENNIIIGWCRAEIFEDLRESLEKTTVPFVNYSIEERINPFLTMPEVKSIIAIGMSYKKTALRPKDNIPRGAISVGAIGTDYHKELMEILEKISSAALSDYKNMLFVDTGPMVDRYIAYKAGLGFFGKHGNIINRNFGSMFFIGYIFTDAEMDYYMTPVDKKCAECKKCISACPGGAIKENDFDYTHCISYLTQSKEELTSKQKEIMGIQLYGCDICQKVCPYNRDFTEVSSDEAYPPLEEILALSNKEFKNRFGHTAAGWRGKKIIQRNAEIAIENINNLKGD